jgi:serine/threonine-protein kinase
MASVHLARMDGPGGFQKWVAIKRIHPHLVEDDQFVDMFLDEARIAAGINHANVAQVFDLGKDDNTYWIAMEYLHGEPLREIMRRAEEQRMLISPDLAARICADAAEGLHAAHELRGKNGQLLGLVHRDVTPHNLFITYEGYTKVVDFGIAKVADRLSQTRAGTLKGKLAYMSPEQVRGAEVDRTTDVFALGVVLWELTTNQRLFRMDTDLDTLEKVQACIVPPPSTIIRDYPVELESVVMKALAKRKQDRYATAREFSKALQNYLLRRGAFVGPEEVAQFIRHVFADRIQKREAHLAWAAEVTGTLNVDQIRAGGKPGAEEEISLVDAIEDKSRPGGPQPPQQQHQPPQQQQQHKATPMPAPAPPPPQQQQQMAATSLLDDDEDVPTTVASRDHIEAMSAAAAAQAQAGPQRGMPQPERSQPRPAAGMPVGNANPGFGPRPGQYPMNDERTAALPGGMYPGGNGGGDDLGATVALPSSLKQQEYGRPQQQPQQQQQQPQNPGFGMGGGFAPMQQQHEPPRFQSQQPFTPSYGVQPGAYPNMPMPGPGGMPRQSQIETAVSLPRPDPAAVWLAQQEVNRGTRKNTGVLIAVVALTALCVIGISALIYYKLKMAAPTPAPVGAEMTSPSGAPTASAAQAAMTAPAAATAAAAAAAPTQPSAAPAPSAAPTAAAAAAAPAAAGAAPAAAGAGAGSPAAAASAAPAAAKEEPGFLTVVCNPYCDDVIDQGRSLGPSPVVHVSVKPGQHRITLKRGTETKVISVIVVSGQVTAQRVSMK